MKKVCFFCLINLFFMANVFADCNDYEHEITINNYKFCFSLSEVSNNAFISNTLTDYNVKISNNLIDIEASSLSIDSDSMLQFHLYDPLKKAFSSFAGTYSKDGLILNVIHKYEPEFNFDYEYNIYDDINCINLDDGNLNNCNLIANFNPTVKININKKDKKIEENEELEIELFKEKKDSDNGFLIIIGGFLFLFVIVAVVFILIKKYW